MGDAPFQADYVAWQSATIDRIERRTPRAKSFSLRPARWNTFQAGQHLDVRLTAADDYQVQRSYSISSSPLLKGLYEITVDLLDDGEVSPFFHDVAEVGDTIEIRGPFGGHFVWSPEAKGPLLLVGGGSGVAPLMSMVRHHAAISSPVALVLLYSARTWEHVIFRDELIARDSCEAEFTLFLNLTRDTARRQQDVSGRIDRTLLELRVSQLGENPRLCFVCGSNPFVGAMTAYLADLGLAPHTIRAERFGG